MPRPREAWETQLGGAWASSQGQWGATEECEGTYTWSDKQQSQ